MNVVQRQITKFPILASLILGLVIGSFAFSGHIAGLEDEMHDDIKLEYETWDIGKGPVAIGEDGSIWATNSNGKLIVFRDEKWTEHPFKPKRSIDTFIPGNSGMMLIHSKGNLAICGPEKVLDSGGYFRVIEDQQEAIVAALSNRVVDFTEERPQFQIAVNSTGQIWVLDGYGLRVFDNGAWYDSADSLLRSGSRSGYASAICSTASGQVFLSDLRMRHDDGVSFWGEFQDGKFHLKEAPHVKHNHQGGYFMKDLSDSIWINTSISKDLGSADQHLGQIAVRTDVDGTHVQVKNAGHARLDDGQGNIWMIDIWGKKDEIVHLRRGDQVIQEITIPEYSRGQLFILKPGSIFAKTRNGLFHLIATSDQSDSYELRNHCTFEEERRCGFVGFSKLGFAVYRDTTQKLYFVKLPG